jgi:hypothetical protein
MAEDRTGWNKRMLTKEKLSILAAAVILCVTSTAFADKLCLKIKVNRKNFKVRTKSVVAATCPRGFKELADTSKFQGPRGAAGAQGPRGAQGPSGGFNPNLCTKRETYKLGSGVLLNQATCEPSEILVTWACSSDAINNQHLVRESILFRTEGSNYPELYSGIACRMQALEGQQIVTVQALCCEPS